METKILFYTDRSAALNTGDGDGGDGDGSDGHGSDGHGVSVSVVVGGFGGLRIRNSRLKEPPDDIGTLNIYIVFHAAKGVLVDRQPPPGSFSQWSHTSWGRPRAKQPTNLSNLMVYQMSWLYWSGPVGN